MTSYAVAIVNRADIGPPIVEYLQRIDATLAPFEGHFIVHGGEKAVMEGSDPGAFIVIEFPTRSQADGWYSSAAYQEILPLRTGSSDGIVFIVDGVDRNHLATDVLA